tara:strand:- start:1045 stop:1245 length:201 start_codon:yes stop_codon:yes gene_type:complete
MGTNQKNNARYVALLDVTEFINELKDVVKDENGDVWFVTRRFLDTKENRLLNKRIGLKNINYFKNK